MDIPTDTLDIQQLYGSLSFITETVCPQELTSVEQGCKEVPRHKRLWARRKKSSETGTLEGREAGKESDTGAPPPFQAEPCPRELAVSFR